MICLLQKNLSISYCHLWRGKTETLLTQRGYLSFIIDSIYTLCFPFFQFIKETKPQSTGGDGGATDSILQDNLPLEKVIYRTTYIPPLMVECVRILRKEGKKVLTCPGQNFQK